ncbi:sigma-54 interaction domain-containing protein [Syntrophorhabdus aromaticivorans]|uniref:sigma-54 interaction domain-containing protein n=1 Tax=Syntrophorhabdus aromaticivorans TaxID=328301 RepID=UPI000A020AFE|nr:sigma 54-interacting transcriptional regulator [Syntrophorhabdus aromaticivorans]
MVTFQIMDTIEKITEKQVADKGKADIVLSVLEEYGLTQPLAYALRFVLRNPYESFLVVGADARVQFMDRGSEKYFGLPQGGAKGVDIREFIPESGLPIAIKTGVPMIGRVFEVKGKKMIGSVYPIIHNQEIVGAVGRLIFHSLEEIERVNKEISKLKKEIYHFKEKERNEYSSKYTFEDVRGKSTAIRETIDFAKKISPLDTDVLIIGESGTGKELFAHSIHSSAYSSSRPFVRVNCPSIPFDLAESELFGYARGAFSGALSSGKPGKFEMANSGTIFLDEISSLPLSVQAKLLRVLQEREIERLGSTKTEKINFKLIAATNIDLKVLVKEGKFREDLYYRIAKAIIHIPPLRDRKEDIPLYIRYFLDKINQSFKTQIMGLSREVTDIFSAYPWPGNVRELINVLEQAMLKAWDKEVLLAEHLSSELLSFRRELPEMAERRGDTGTRPTDFHKEIEEKERRLISSALRDTKGNRKKAALLLNMPRSTFYEKLKRYGIRYEGHSSRKED